MQPAYMDLLESGELERRIDRATQALESCEICAWHCRVNRRAGKLGVCRTAERAWVASFGPHMGEEAPLSGWRGSGTIFFARCNMRCQFCQNHDISSVDAGREVEAGEIAAMMLELQEYGCHNINLVTPSHVVPQILTAVMLAARSGLRLPLVYNTGGYDGPLALQLLDGVIDIYMPDMKYAGDKIGQKYSRTPHYPAANQAAVREMHRQVGDLVIDDSGLAVRGLLVRHLVLPHHLAGTAQIAGFLASQISKDTFLNVMDQYHPAHIAYQYTMLRRAITPAEYQAARSDAQAAGLHRIYPG